MINYENKRMELDRILTEVFQEGRVDAWLEDVILGPLRARCKELKTK